MSKSLNVTRRRQTLGGAALASVLAASALAVAVPIAPSPAVAQPASRAAPLWFAPSAGNAPQRLLALLATAEADGLNPRRYDARRLAGVVGAASAGDPMARRQAEQALNAALVAFVRDQKHDPKVGIIYVDPELRPSPPSAASILADAARAPNLADYIEKMGWMNPIYAQLRQALASRLYRNRAERQLIEVNRERARALPGGTGRYAIVNAPAARMYLYENGQVVDSMRVVAGRPDPHAQTPMMNAYIRFVTLNPYWNSPADVTAHTLAPKVLKEGRTYLNRQGYQLMSDWSDRARVLDPMSVDWRAVAAGTVPVRLRQKPGPANSMGKMKFMFPNDQGIWLHDTPVREKIEDAARLASAGCVRLEDAARFARWLYGRPLAAQGAKPEQKVALPRPVPLYITYLTAVPSGTSIVYFDDFYGKDRAQGRRRG
ncbi:MAG: L,D-transpeptidase family protein [Sphingomicrobium sp.]